MYRKISQCLTKWQKNQLVRPKSEWERAIWISKNNKVTFNNLYSATEFGNHSFACNMQNFMILFFVKIIRTTWLFPELFRTFPRSTWENEKKIKGNQQRPSFVTMFPAFFDGFLISIQNPLDLLHCNFFRFFELRDLEIFYNANVKFPRSTSTFLSKFFHKKSIWWISTTGWDAKVFFSPVKRTSWDLHSTVVKFQDSFLVSIAILKNPVNCSLSVAQSVTKTVWNKPYVQKDPTISDKMTKESTC
jgi:hypothetical protein